MNRLFKKLISVVVMSISLTFSNCSQQDNLLEEALEAAGNNRDELEKVIKHYEDDSLKLEAAKFLIRNMPGHYSYADTVRVNRYYHSVDSMFDRFHGQPIDSIRNEINEFAKMWDVNNIPYVMDIRIITSAYLIENIDKSFKQWRESPWCSHLNFEEFCEFILPYKSEELQPFDNWRDEFGDICKQELDILQYADLFKNSSFRAATIVRDVLVQQYHPNLSESVQVPVYKTSTRLRIPFGMCEDYVARMNTVFRSIGIPVVMEFTPQWTYGDGGHDWNIVLTRKGRLVPFSGLFTSPGEQHKPFENMPKAYRRTYAQNVVLRRINKEEAFVPPFFRNIFIKDVTENHMSVVDLKLDVDDESDGVAYLAIANGMSWEPIAWGFISNGVATFENVGRECIYLPVRYSATGKQIVIGAPVRVEANGMVSALNPRHESLCKVVLFRKYPVLEYVYSKALKIVGGQFQVSSNLEFSDAKNIANVKEPKSVGCEIVLSDSVGMYQFWRYINHAAGSNSSIAEISFIDGEGKKLRGRPIGTAPLYGRDDNAADMAFDENLLTNFNASAQSGGWVGMDFEKPVAVHMIRYYARGDGNAIDPGDKYELFYWDMSGSWRSLGCKIANGASIEFRSVPENALLLLRDLTKGHNEHVFIYQNGLQKWW